MLLLTVFLVPWWLAVTLLGQGKEVIDTMDSLWPVLVASIFAWVVLRHGFFRTVQSFPAGDVLVLMERSLQLLYPLGNGLISFSYHWKKWKIWLEVHLLGLLMVAKERLQSMEDNFSRWEGAILFVAIMALSMSLIARNYYSA